jgi:hypothetical protein
MFFRIHPKSNSLFFSLLLVAVLRVGACAADIRFVSDGFTQASFAADAFPAARPLSATLLSASPLSGPRQPPRSLEEIPREPEAASVWTLMQAGGDPADVGAAGKPGEGRGGRPDEEYGEAPSDHSLQFLRGQAVLLAEGQWQFDYGLVYAVDASHLPALDMGNVVRADVERRRLFAPLGVRYGWDQRTQIFASLPIGFAHTELGTPFTDLNSNTFDVGDLTIGASRLIQQGNYYCPDIIFTFDARVPLGDSTVPPDLTSADMGGGYWAASAALLFVHQYDPMIVYWGGGFRYGFEATNLGQSYDPGHELNYQLGTGFAVNDRMTLGAGLLGTFITEAEYNDIGSGGNRDSIRGRLSLTTWRNCRIVEPFVEFGMTTDAPDAALGVVLTR